MEGVCVRKQCANLYAVSYFPLEAQVWMDTAVRLDYESNRPLKIVVT